MLFVLNVAAFEIAWFSSVFGGAQHMPGGAQHMPWLGPVTVLIVIAFHLHAARKPFEEVLLVLICALIGAGFDSILVATGWVTYKAGLFSNYFAPCYFRVFWWSCVVYRRPEARWHRLEQ
jgi:multisubunit Na+/H+ antiporter MnhB subunit